MSGRDIAFECFARLVARSRYEDEIFPSVHPTDVELMNTLEISPGVHEGMEQLHTALTLKNVRAEFKA
jgi:hypothetical protein